MTHRIQAQIQAVRHHLRRVSKPVREAVLISITARTITYTAVMVEWGFPKWSGKLVNCFWASGYNNPMPVKWVIKYCTDDLAWVLMSYLVCKISAQISNYLFLVSVIFLGYHLIDVFMFFYNYKTSSLVYIDLMWTALALIWSVFKGYKPETIAKIKSLF